MIRKLVNFNNGFQMYFYSKQITSNVNIQKQMRDGEIIRQKQALAKISLEPPTYSTFRKYKLTLPMISVLIEQIQKKNDLDINIRLLFVNNLLSYTRKIWGRSLIKAKEESLQFIVDELDNIKFNNTKILPGLFQNISYSFSPELYLDKASQILIANASRMPINELTNSIYGISKIARKRVQDTSDPSSQASIQKVQLYNSAQSTLIRLIPFLQLKQWTQIEYLVETLIAYQKLEITDEQNFGCFMIDKVLLLLQNKEEQFQPYHSQLIHTLQLYQQNPISTREKEQIYMIVQGLLTRFEGSIQKLSQNSMCLSLLAFEQIDEILVTTALVEQCQLFYCQKETQANIQDLSMLIQVSFKKRIMNPQFSKLITDHYEQLRLNVDINVISRIVNNLGDMINQRYLDKKFLNMFLISIKVMFLLQLIKKILNDKRKINQRFVNAFIKERKIIENEEIQEKFAKIENTLIHT